MDAQELFVIGSAHGLGFERREQRLEPFERGSVLADPDEFDAAKTLGRVGAKAHVVDGLENRGPGSDTNTGTDEHGDFVLENVLGRCSVRSVDAERRHLLAVLKSDFVHAHGV